MKKLIKIQSELKAPKSQFNAFGKYKYRKCEDVLEALKPLLKAEDCTLTISDEIKEVCGLVFIEATATLTDGKDSVSVTAQAGIDTNRKGMDIAQSFGSSSSYARKYALNGLFLIDDTQDADAVDNSKVAPVVKAKPNLLPKSNDWENVRKALQNGNTWEQVALKFTVSAAARLEMDKQLGK